ncbi:MAG: hypothetical protein KDK74_14615 [Cephaloticoccus sp.]|nr:hypothetical protein [Cephaloticoccus sp.]
MKRSRRSVVEKPAPCRGKRRYQSQGDALDAAMVVGVERQRRAYVCPWCGLWHLTTIREN